jgi:hypothetical protein
MSHNAVLPLDSYRLAQYAVQAPCYICGEGNTFDAEMCRHCHAPMALAHQAKSQKIRPLMMAVVGSAGAGKTVFLGMLSDMLSRPNDDLQLLARGAFSITLQQATMAALAKCEFPAKTPNEPDRWNWMHYQARLKGRRSALELIMPDMAGEAILAEINHPHAYPVIRAFFTKCVGAMLLVDAERLDDGDQQTDLQTMKILSYLSELESDRQRGWGNRPLAVVFTKADQCDGSFDNPEEFARKSAPGLWHHCRERFRRSRFFAAGVAGSCIYRRDLGGKLLTPLRIEPRGVTEPFLWLVNQFK